MSSLFQELKRRKVFRVAVAYAVVAWVLIQISSEVLPALQMPEWTVSFVTVLLLLGFPVALLLGWAFELTPDGIKADAGVQSRQPVNQGADPKLNYAILGLVLLVVGFQIADRFVLDSRDSPDQVADFLSDSTLSSAQSTQIIRASLNLGEMSPSTSTGLYSEIALSPDGSRLVYSAVRNGEAALYLRELNEEVSSVIVNLGVLADFSSASVNPVFSNDSESIFYSIGNDGLNMQIAEYSLNNGITQVRVDQSVGSNFSAADDGSIWYQGPRFAMYRYLPNTATEPIRVSEIDGLGGRAQPQSLPGGRSVLFTLLPTVDAIIQGTANIHLLHLDTNESELLIEGAHNPHYVPTGHIAFMRGTTLWAVAFDVENLRITGNEYPVLQEIASSYATGQTSFSFSENGRLVYLPAESNPDIASPNSGFDQLQTASLSWIDRQGEESLIDIAGLTVSWSASQLSPNEDKIAITVLDGLSESIWVYDIERETISRLTDGIGYNPKWSADGETIYYSGGGISSIASNGLGDRVQHYRGRAINTEVTPDGAQFIFDTSNTALSRTQGSSDIFSLPTSARRDIDVPTALIATPFDEQDAAISPDGNWIAYASNRSGRSEIYVQPFPNLEDDRWQISNSGGYKPQWTSNGTELVYAEDMGIASENILGSHIVSVAIDTTDGFSPGIPEPLFALERVSLDFTVSSDGSRFLFSGFDSGGDDNLEDYVRPVSLTLIENWFEELKRLAPADLE